jgi:hypothetical protein
MADVDGDVPTRDAASSPPLSKKLRWLVSILVVLHISAVVVSPSSVPPTSAFWDKGWWLFRPYLQLMYLNHGYKYFAPEPGPSTLLAYTLEFDDGTTRQETIPNRGIHPRLLYHRHFMLSEFLNFAPDDWHRTYARHLCRTYGAKSVSMSRMTRLLPTMEEVRTGATLTDPERYLETPLGLFRCDEL